MNFLVTIIIAVVIFSFGVTFIYSLTQETTDIRDRTLDELDSSIADLLCKGSQRVCVGENRLTIRRGEVDVVGLKIMNVLGEELQFELSMQEASPPGYREDDSALPPGQLVWHPRSRAVTLAGFEEQTIGLGLQVPEDTESGTYIFDIDVKYPNTANAGQLEEYASTKKLYVTVP